MTTSICVMWYFKHTVKLEWEPEGVFVPKYPVFTAKKLIFYHQDILHNTKLIYGLWHSGHLCAHNTACINQVCVFMYAIPCAYASVCGQGAWNSPWRSFTLHVIRLDEVWHILHDAVKGHMYQGKAQTQWYIRNKNTQRDRQYLCSLAPDPLLSSQLIDTGIPVISGHFLTPSQPPVMT